jgi:hypothetical protein
MQTIRALTVPGLIAALCVGFGCSSSNEGGDKFFPTNTGGSSSSTGSTPGMGTGNAPGTSTGGTGSITVPGASGSGNTAGDGGVDKCTGTEAGTTPLPPILEFLIDYSGSMNERPMMATTGPRKYESTRDALIQAFTDMQDGTGTGLIFYPNAQGGKSGGMCITRQEAVRVQTLNAMVRQSLITALQAKTTSGATPTHDAFVYAADTLAASTLMGDKYVVVVTDGAPTYSLGCVGDGMTPADTAPLIQAVADANTQRAIKTFVIGSPGSESARASLSAMATQGGTAPPGCSDAGPNYCHFDMTTAPDLSAALNTAFKAITKSVATCSYTIPPPGSGEVIDPAKVNVKFTNSAGTVTDVKKDPDTNGGCSSGWQYAANNTQIILCPDTCDLVKADPMSKVAVVLGCKTTVR